MKKLYNALTIDCQKCCGLCCIALYCTKTDGFPYDKVAGTPCKNLLSDFRCHSHHELIERKLKGCLSYDCFGAGQKVTQIIYKGEDWRKSPHCRQQMFEVFHIVTQLHQVLWYLLETYRMSNNQKMQEDIRTLIRKNEHMTTLSPNEILMLDIESYRKSVNTILKGINTSQPKKVDYMGKNFKRANLDGKDFSMSFLIMANLEGCSLKGTNFLGADLRDTNIQNTDLSESIFLTQMQVNAARGNKATQLPKHLTKPTTW